MPATADDPRRTKLPPPDDGGGGNPGPGTTGTRVYVEFTTKHLRVRALPGESDPKVTDGYAAYETVERPFKIGLTRWTGFAPLALDVPVILEGWLDGKSIEDDIQRLELMAGRGPGASGEPPDVEIAGPGALVPHSGAKWRITGFDWGDAVLNEKGFRFRQFVTVSLIQSVVDEHAKERSAARRKEADKKRHHHPRSYVVKKGDTLRKIARKVLGDETRWAEIRSLNHIGDPRRVGKCTDKHKKGCIGTRLRMPR